jgi:hypothetical protein
MIGGEYNFALSDNEVWTNLGEIYDPVANTWTCLSAPSGWNQLGDAMSIVLPNGTFLLGNALGSSIATLNLGTNPPTWSIINPTGKSADDNGYNNEEGWTLLPNGKVLTLENWNSADTTTTPALQYNPATQNWDSAGTAPDPLVLIKKGNTIYYEMGPVTLRPDGTVFAAGATGFNDIYNTNSASWTSGPAFPTFVESVSCSGVTFSNQTEQYVAADAPAALLTNGNVLVEASPVDTNCGWVSPSVFFEFDGTNLNQVAATPNSSRNVSFNGRLLPLPNGQIFFDDTTGDAEVYTPTGTPFAGSAPTITTSPAAVGVGATNMLITGTQLNGLSGAVAYGDDYQAATNYPLVRISNLASGHVFYARTHGFSTMGVATGTATESTYFDVPANIETGNSTLVVVANGIPSTSVPISILPASTTSLVSLVNPSTNGTQVTFKATVTNLGAAPGTVTFYDGTTSLATVLAANVTLAAGVATFQTSSLSIGTHTITATYSGDSTFGSSRSLPLVQVVNGQATTTTVVPSPNPSVLNNSVKFSATVTPTGGGTPTGTVTYLDANSTLDGNTILGTVTLSGGVAPSINASLQFSGTHSITAVYSGDSTFSGSTSAAVAQVVNNPVPAVSSLGVTSVTAGHAAFTLVVSGGPFVNGSTINFNNNSLSTTFNGSSEVYATVPATDLTTAGIFPVTVTNPGPGGGTSAPVNFTVNNPAPTLTGISPTSGMLGQTVSSFMLTGTNFMAGSTVNFGSSQITGGTVGASGTTLTVTVPGADLSVAGLISVTVTNPTPGGGTSAAQTFTVINPAPTIASISPSTALVGSAAFTMTVNGAGFLPASTVNFNGVAQATTFVSAIQLTAMITTTDIATAGIFPVTVTNPAPGGTSAAVNFTVTNPVPTISSLLQSSIIAGSAGFALTVNGTAFVNGAAVNFNGSSRPTTFVNSTQLTASITASDIASTGWDEITVVNSGPGGGQSNAAAFTVNGGSTSPITGSALRYVPVTPCRLVDTRTTPNGPFAGPSIAGGTLRTFTIPSGSCSIPSTAAAYSLNVAVIPTVPLGFLTLWPTGQTQPVAATVSSIDGRVRSNAAIVPAGAGGAISVFASNTTNLVLDINGYFTTASTALQFYPVTPCRVVDTRNAIGSFGGPSLAGNTSRTFALPASPCNLPATAQAYSLNLTAVPQVPLGFLTAWPTGQTQPGTANLSSTTGTVTASGAIVPAGTSGSINVFASNTTDLVIDADGYFAPAATGGLSLYTLPPCRVLDTRQLSDTQTTQPFTGELDENIQTTACGVPVGAQAYVLNATVVPAAPLGFLTLWPQGTMQPLAATLSALDQTVTSNLAIVPTTNGSISTYAANPTQLVLDIFGYFGP